MNAVTSVRIEGRAVRAWRFVRKPWRDKTRSIYFRWVRTFPKIPAPLRLPFGLWWLVRNDFCSLAILDGTFETGESQWMAGFLRAGMTVIDVGAHHGYYTLLASRKVGRSGFVSSFEPSPREYRFLTRHVELNGCTNVTVENAALGSKSGEAELFVVDGSATGCNSLRPPSVAQPTRTYQVPLVRLDDYLERKNIQEVNFVKVDAEGAEMDILRGASRLLERVPRPVILAEVQDARTRSWGYEAREIIAFLEERDFRWYQASAAGRLEALPTRQETYDGNFVAIPAERMYGDLGMKELSGRSTET